MSTEYVYILQCPNSQRIKIGRTGGEDPYKRIAAIQTSSPFPLKVIKVFESTKGTENHLHKQFDSYRVWGEWFNGECLPSVLDSTSCYRVYENKKITGKELTLESLAKDLDKAGNTVFRFVQYPLHWVKVELRENGKLNCSAIEGYTEYSLGEALQDTIQNAIDWAFPLIKAFHENTVPEDFLK
jgi:hypothetical protein